MYSIAKQRSRGNMTRSSNRLIMIAVTHPCGVRVSVPHGLDRCESGEGQVVRDLGGRGGGVIGYSMSKENFRTSSRRGRTYRVDADLRIDEDVQLGVSGQEGDEREKVRRAGEVAVDTTSHPTL